MSDILNNSLLKGGLLLSVIAGIGMWLKSVLPVVWRFIMLKISYNVKVESKSQMYFIFNDWPACITKRKT